MKTIKSFLVNHDVLTPGVYLSRIDRDVVTYDLRFRHPNREEVLRNDSIHTIEHLFATYARNSQYSDHIIYFGPMGCRTGFYFLTSGLDDQTVLQIIKDGMAFVKDYEGEIPGTTAIECGNYREHSLELAKIDAARYCDEIKNWTVADMEYVI